MVDAFEQAKADFSGMSPKKGLYLPRPYTRPLLRLVRKEQKQQLPQLSLE
jgi:serine protease inhibitor